VRPRTEVGRNSFPTTSPTFPVHGCPDGKKSVWARHTPLYPSHVESADAVWELLRVEVKDGAMPPGGGFTCQ
jgi:hypothetical protein